VASQGAEWVVSIPVMIVLARGLRRAGSNGSRSRARRWSGSPAPLPN